MASMRMVLLRRLLLLIRHARLSACPGKVDTGFPKKDMRMTKTAHPRLCLCTKT
jgi:hypothetical protein